jgi:hypothetical protein
MAKARLSRGGQIRIRAVAVEEERGGMRDMLLLLLLLEEEEESESAEISTGPANSLDPKRCWWCPLLG